MSGSTPEPSNPSARLDHDGSHVPVVFAIRGPGGLSVDAPMGDHAVLNVTVTKDLARGIVIQLTTGPEDAADIIRRIAERG
ncbi:hypothetical protein [Piscinibacter defluvii]|uniref:hypothetical protein n=1 Tax=Piscinibacter defluvii TaxID=1796922 RepID=UPI000FDE7EE1|nr:hypothetical protein [Piscinibacter defluvii]